MTFYRISHINFVIGKTVAARRKALNLTQAQLAEKAGVQVNYISEIERGLKNPSGAVLFNLAIALKTKPEQFIREIDEAYNYEYTKKEED